MKRGVPQDGECGIKDDPSYPVVKAGAQTLQFGSSDGVGPVQVQTFPSLTHFGSKDFFIRVDTDLALVAFLANQLTTCFLVCSVHVSIQLKPESLVPKKNRGP